MEKDPRGYWFDNWVGVEHDALCNAPNMYPKLKVYECPFGARYLNIPRGRVYETSEGKQWMHGEDGSVEFVTYWLVTKIQDTLVT